MDKKNILFFIGFINVFAISGLWFTFTQPDKSFLGPGLQLVMFLTTAFITALLYFILKIKWSIKGIGTNVFLIVSVIQLIMFIVTFLGNILPNSGN